MSVTPPIPLDLEAFLPIRSHEGLTDAERLELAQLDYDEEDSFAHASTAVSYEGLSSAEQLEVLQLQQEILNAVARNQDHMEVLSRICLLEEQLVADAVASVMLLDDDYRLNMYVAPGLPPDIAQRFNGLKPGPQAGSCGTAIYCREAVFVSNTLTDERWGSLRGLADELGLMACWSVPIVGASGQLLGTFALSSFVPRSPDLLHQKVLEIGAAIIGIVLERQRQTESLRLLGKVFESSNQAIVVMDRKVHVSSVNRAFSTMTGYVFQEVRDKKPTMLASEYHDRAFYRTLWRTLLRKGYWQGEIWSKRKGGEVFPAWLSLTAVRESGVISHFVGFFFDISEQKATEERLAFLTGHDPLTGLPNRLILRSRLAQAMLQAERQHQRMALLYVDLDGFKTINASFGEVVGDAALKAVASRLANSVGVARDSFLARLDSDEFAIVLPDLSDPAQATLLAECILADCALPLTVAGHGVDSTLSIGIALYPQDGADGDSLLKKARNAMEYAKQAGRNTFHFYADSMSLPSADPLMLRNSLRQALARGEFFLEYQPQIDLVSGQIVGAEALVRWQHPEHGRVSPATFIPLAEQCGVIVPLGEWVLQEACRQGALWQKQGFGPLLMAVNLSSVQFKRGNLEHSVVQALADSKLPAACLELELTESILIEDTENVLKTVQGLKSLGIKLSIDDFGTGYSSLAYLTRLAVDKLKIDQSFVRSMEDAPANAAIIRAIIQMAHSLGLKAIAEGVETDKARQFLLSNHCDEAQGYWFSRPISAGDFADLLEAEMQQGQD